MLPAVRDTMLDRVISYVAPGAGLARRAARTKLALSGGAYNGAKRDRKAGRNWSTTGGSPDADLLPDLPDLRERSRDLMVNAPLARGAVNTVVTNVVGTGLRLQAQIDRKALGLTDDAAEDWQEQAERLFYQWAESAECDAARTSDFYDMQDIVLRCALTDGDSFPMRRWLPRAGAAFGTKIQLIEADRVSNPNNKADSRTQRAGVEINPSTGAPLAYHVQNSHPGDLGQLDRTWLRIPAFGGDGTRLMLHCFKPLRPDQRRGEPYLAPVIEMLKQLDRYSEAEIYAAVLNAFFAIKTETPDGTGMAPTDGATAPAGKRPEISGESGMIVDLAPGEDVIGFTPARPASGFDDFVMAILRQIGVALELPFEILVKHFTASYSAARAAILEAWKFFSARRAWLARNFCDPAYAWVIAEAVADGRLAAPRFFDDPAIRAAWLGAEWIGPGMGQLNPVDETKAAKMRIDEELSTRSKESAALNGGDYRANHAQRVREEKQRQADQVTLAAPIGHNGGPPLDAPAAAADSAAPAGADAANAAADKAENKDLS